ncbi:MAG: hypothetical protein HW389_2831, partial [Bacteroidetes bacterium]|nr:hypothetical protein [Bacteroidota bacterium]
MESGTSTFFLPLQKESGQKEKGGRNRTRGLVLPPACRNFRAGATQLMIAADSPHGNYGKCVGGISTCVMISEVLFGYFLFKEKVT